MALSGRWSRASNPASAELSACPAMHTAISAIPSQPARQAANQSASTDTRDIFRVSTCWVSSRFDQAIEGRTGLAGDHCLACPLPSILPFHRFPILLRFFSAAFLMLFVAFLLLSCFSCCYPLLPCCLSATSALLSCSFLLLFCCRPAFSLLSSPCRSSLRLLACICSSIQRRHGF